MPTPREFSLALQGLTALQADTPGTTETAVPALHDVLAALGTLPPGGLFLGVAEDGLPLLLNLHDPHPGPMLIAGDPGAGKTLLLQTLAHSLLQMQPAAEIQFGVITAAPAEWEAMESTPHLVGIFPPAEGGARSFLRSLSSRAHANRSRRDRFVLLVDDLEAAASLDPETVQSFRWLLLRGPARGVWPVVTLHAPRYGQVLAWLPSFRTRVFGRVADRRVAEALGAGQAAGLDQLAASRWFTLRENGSWLRFWLPRC